MWLHHENAQAMFAVIALHQEHLPSLDDAENDFY
jgi:hypothetical protein